VSDGGETIEFELVEDATFHNGDSVTAEDVRYSLDRAANNDISVHQSKLAVLSDPVAEEGVTVDGDYSLTLNLDSPFAPIFMNLTCNVAPSGAIVPQDVIEEMGEDSYNLTPVGSGPFEVVNHELGNELVLDATDDWHQANDNGDPLPYLDGIDITPIQEPTTRVSAIRTGDVDFVSLIPAAQADTLEEASDVVLEERLGPNFGGLGFNSSLEPFTDQRVRMAVAKSIDAERYVEETFLGYGEADTSIYNPVLGWVYRDEFGDDPDQKPEDQLHDPEGAVELAEEADAMDLELTMTVAQPELRGARVMRNMINDVLGWEIELNQQDYPTLFERAADGDILWMPWGNSTVPEPDLTVSADWGEEVATNWWGWFPDDHAEQVEAQRQATDREERKQILWEIEDRIIEEAPWALLEHQSALSARRPRLKNYFHYGPIKRFHTVYLEE
jgi:peptide/nickel transport system substrate-binding protein